MQRYRKKVKDQVLFLTLARFKKKALNKLFKPKNPNLYYEH